MTRLHAHALKMSRSMGIKKKNVFMAQRHHSIRTYYCDTLDRKQNRKRQTKTLVSKTKKTTQYMPNTSQDKTYSARGNYSSNNYQGILIKIG